jgi:HD-GYP domain-containing protein (c-di-GMP phosphodiesterase class II)
MKFFRKKNQIEVSHPVTAIDGRVIARKGDKIDHRFLNLLREHRLPPAERGRKFRDTHHYFNFKVILDAEKYGCLAKLIERKEQVLNTVGSVPVSHLADEELSWMERYKYHYDHTLAVTALVTLMTLELHPGKEEALEAASCALTHDFGITRVPEQILNKVSPLDEQEMKVVQEHPIYSFCLLTYYGYDESDLNAIVAYEHHENLLGTGYPRGVVPELQLSQIIQVCDVFDALISARPFRPAKTREQAIEIIGETVVQGEIQTDLFKILQSCIQ